MKLLRLCLPCVWLGCVFLPLDVVAAGLGGRPAAVKRVPGPVPLGAANKMPWGKTVDGLACRLLVNPGCAVGQPVSAVVEIKNTSDRVRHFVQIFNLTDRAISQMKVVGPNGKRLRQMSRSKCRPGYASMKPIGPGETLTIDIPDLGGLFARYNRALRRMESLFDQPGEYALTYTFKGARLPKSMVVGSRGDGTRIKREFPDEVMKNMWSGTLVSNTAKVELVPLGKDDLRVHEWGVFTVFPDAKYASVNRKAEWESLPKFFYRQFPTQRLRWEPAAWDKPVVYFYSKPHCLRVDVSVAFSEGAPVVWWPACEKPVDDGGRTVTRKPLFRKLCWRGWLGESIPLAMGTNPTPNQHGWQAVSSFAMPKDCWLHQARLKDAAPITVRGTTVKRGAPWTSHQQETERFIFYDGLVPAPAGLRCTAVDAGSVTLKNGAAFAMGHLFVVDRRKAAGANGVRFGQLDTLAPGATGAIKLAEVPRGQWPTAARTAIHAALLDAGLLRPEATALVDIWAKGFFQSSGVTALHLLPRSEYDRMVAVDIRPKPSELVRVGVALHPRIERQVTGVKPVLERVARLIKQLDSDDWREREAAANALVKIGLPAARLLKQALRNPPSFEVSERCKDILRQIDASDYLRAPGGQ